MRRWLYESGSLDICAVLCAFGRLVSHLPRAETNPNKRSVWMELNNQMLRQSTSSQLQILSLGWRPALHFFLSLTPSSPSKTPTPPPPPFIISFSLSFPLFLSSQRCFSPPTSLPSHHSLLCFIKNIKSQSASLMFIQTNHYCKQTVTVNFPEDLVKCRNGCSLLFRGP